MYLLCKENDLKIGKRINIVVIELKARKVGRKEGRKGQREEGRKEREGRRKKRPELNPQMRTIIKRAPPQSAHWWCN